MITYRDIVMRVAHPGDASEVSRILTEAANYLIAIEQPLWDPAEMAVNILLPDIQASRYYVCERNAIVVGVLKYQLEDQTVWPEIADESSAFIHRLAVSRAVAGHGVAAAMLQWAKEHTQAIGRRYLRLDCAIRPKLCTVYERNGFRKHSERTIGPYHVARYEYRLDPYQEIGES